VLCFKIDAVEVAEKRGLQMIDFTDEQRMMRDAKMIQIFDGTNQIQRVIVARNLLV